MGGETEMILLFTFFYLVGLVTGALLILNVQGN
jgi:hypothetical protein